jgi:cytochrome P450
MEPDIAELMADDRPWLALPDGATALGDCPVHRAAAGADGEFWLLTGHADIRRLLPEPVFSRAAAVDPEHPDPSVDTSLLAMDAPEHTACGRSSPGPSARDGSAPCGPARRPPPPPAGRA